MTHPLSPGFAFPATMHGRYHAHLVKLRSAALVGVYLIADATTREPLYVGECHTPRAVAMYDTITRHFRHWTGDNGYADGRRRGGKTYNRARVLIDFAALATNDPAIVAAVQHAEIQRLRPRDNQIDGRTRARAGTITTRGASAANDAKEIPI